MSKALRRYNEDEKKKVITRRLKEKKGGIGYWSVMDYLKHRPKPKED